MNNVETKAMRLVLGGKVRVKYSTLTDDGTIQEAHGFVQGDSGLWEVEIDGDTTTCTCPYGEARQDAHGHSHDLALRLAATQTEGQE